MLRPIDVTRLTDELRRMRRLNERNGVPLLGEYFERILRDGWVARNPEIYHLYEVNGELQGHVY